MQLARFDAGYADAVVRSFRDDAIRTAVLIDDQFPNYTEMRGANDADFKEVDRAIKLYDFLHGRGLVCGIENWRKHQEESLNLIDKVRKSDLVVLDYRLGAAGPKSSLMILRHLAISPHFNLVVLYTNDDLQTVSLAAAAAMRGVKAPDAQLVPSEEVLEEAADVLLEFKPIDVASLTTFLTSGEKPWQGDVQAAMTDKGLNLRNLRSLTDHIGRKWIEELFEGYAPDGQDELGVRCGLSNADTLWIQAGSCFVAVVGKLKASDARNEGDYVWERLGNALKAWHPNYYRLVLSEIQNALELEAVVDQEAWLNDNLCLGLGLYLLESDKAAAGELSKDAVAGSAQSLVDRFVDLIRQRLASHAQVTETATDTLEALLKTAVTLPGGGETARHVRARELARVAAGGHGDWTEQILPAVNAFMISDEFRGSHITTGTVLQSGEADYWLCVSPACDLVPRSDAPLVVKLARLNRVQEVKKFTTGEVIAIKGRAGIEMFRALDAETRQPALRTAFLPEGTKVTRELGASAAFRGWFATGASPVCGPNQMKTFTILAQLRGSFATRFLLTAGQQLSRVGVDFVDFRE